MAITQDKVSVVIVSYNSLPSLPDSLRSLKAAVAGRDYELILVDNNSTDGSIRAAREIFTDVIVVQSGRNVGFARACNLGADKASGEFLLFHNPDLQVDPGTVDNLIEVIRKEHKAGAVAGRMRFPDGRFQPTCRRFPTARNMLFSRGSALSRLVNKPTDYTLPDYETTTEVDAVAGTLLMIKTELFRKLGGFDPRFFMYMEDTDLCLRLKQAGYHNYFEPSAGGVHLWGKGSRASSLKRDRYHHISVWKYFLTHQPNGFSVFVLPIILGTNLLLKLFIKADNGT